MELKPAEYWRDRLDEEIMAAVWRGQKSGFSVGGIELTRLAKERLLELLALGGNDKLALLNKIKDEAAEKNKENAARAKEVNDRNKKT